MPFSSKTVYTGDVIVQPLIPAENRTDMLLDAVLNSVITGNHLGDIFRERMMGGLPNKADTVFNLATNRYIQLKPPKVTNVLTNQDDILAANIKSVLETIHGSSVTVSTFDVGFPDPIALAQQVLINDYQMDLETGVIANLIDPEEPGVQQFENSVFEGNFIRIYYDLDGEQRSFLHNKYAIGFDQIYLVVVYRVNSETFDRVWNYNTNSKIYPSIQVLREQSNEEYFPTIPVRQDYVNINKGHPLREGAEHLLNVLGINMDDVLVALNSDGSDADPPSTTSPEDNYIRPYTEVNAAANIQEDTSGNNVPEEIQDCFITFQADLTSEDAYSLDYLFRFFNKERQFQSQQVADGYRYYIANGSIRPGDPSLFRPHILEFSSNIMEKFVIYNFIDFEEITGTIGSVGTVTKEIVLGPMLNVRPIWSKFATDSSEFIIRKQMTEDVYHEIRVNGLFLVEDVHGKTDVVMRLEDVEDGDEGFSIPVSKTIIDNIPNYWFRAQILQSTCSAIIYAVARQRVRWYQRRAFARLLQIAAIVWTVISLGQDGGAALTWAFALQVATRIVINIVVGMILQFGLMIVANIIGYEAAFLLAAAVAVYSIYAGAFSSDPSLPWAGDLLQMSSMTMNTLEENLAADFQRELNAFYEVQKDLEAEYDKVKEINEMLKGDSPDLTDSLFRINQAAAWETPELFYNRTIGNKNPGIASIDAVSVYVERKLQLPKPEDLLFSPA